MKYWIFLFLISAQALASEVAFLEVNGRDGKPIQLEPGGRFMHVAIRYKSQWLHAHAQGGVELVDSLKGFGDKILYLENPNIPDPAYEDFEYWLGRRFDYTYTWGNPIATYCTRLLAELLNIEPAGMNFDSGHWGLHAYREEAIGKVGLSPDDLYKILIDLGYNPECERRLVKML